MIPLAAPTTGAHPQCDSTEAGSKMAEYILQRAWKFTMEAPGTWEQEEKPLIPPSRRGGESLTSSVLGSRNWLSPKAFNSQQYGFSVPLCYEGSCTHEAPAAPDDVQSREKPAAGRLVLSPLCAGFSSP